LRQTQRIVGREGLVEGKTETGVIQLQVKDCQRLPRIARNNQKLGFSLGISTGHQPC
jgi:hypothetical protein